MEPRLQGTLHGNLCWSTCGLPAHGTGVQNLWAGEAPAVLCGTAACTAGKTAVGEALALFPPPAPWPSTR